MDNSSSMPIAPVYDELSPFKLWARRIYSAVTIIMVALAMLFCLIQGKNNGTFYLLFVNLLISCVVIAFLLWWYRTGDLEATKFWFIILVASIIIFQCITTDIFVFNHDKTPSTPSSTISPITIRTIAPNATTNASRPLNLLDVFTQGMFTAQNHINPPSV